MEDRGRCSHRSGEGRGPPWSGDIFYHEFGDAVYEFRFRALEGCSSFGLGLDPVVNAEFRGHLLNVGVTPETVALIKGLHTYRDRQDPRTELKAMTTWFDMRKWNDATLTIQGDQVSLTINGKTISAIHPSIKVNKARLIFRCGGSGFQIDDLKGWSLSATPN